MHVRISIYSAKYFSNNMCLNHSWLLYSNVLIFHNFNVSILIWNCFSTKLPFAKDVSLPVAGTAVDDLEAETGLVVSADIVTAGASVVTPVDIHKTKCIWEWIGSILQQVYVKNIYPLSLQTFVSTMILVFFLNTCTCIDIIIHVMLKNHTEHILIEYVSCSSIYRLSTGPTFSYFFLLFLFF